MLLLLNVLVVIPQQFTLATFHVCLKEMSFLHICSEISIIIEWSRFFGFVVEFFNIPNGSALQVKLILLVIQLDQ
jgi:hypothetical protein